MTKDELFLDALTQGLYKVDCRTGQVLSYRLAGTTRLSKKVKVLRGTRDSAGYVRVFLKNKGKVFSMCVHRAVWLSCRGPIPEGYVIDHKNEDKADNRVSNLKAITRAENTIRAHRGKNKIGSRGSGNGGARLTEAEVIEIRRLAGSGISQAELARRFDVSRQQIGHIVRRKSWSWLEV